jgi:hypothetical protein
MRRTLIASLALTLSLLAGPASAGADAWVWNGNDTGGIMPWRRGLHRIDYLDAAERHCAGYHKLARITSVHPRYGDYVVFACRFPRHYDPVKHRGGWWW